MGVKHNDIVNRGTKWLKKHEENLIVPNCPIIAEDLTTATSTGETPDIIGWASWTSVLIEVKVSRSDFLRDKKKWSRVNPELGVGEYRYYLCPEGLIKEKDLPVAWGLLHIDDNNKIHIVKVSDRQSANLSCERTILQSIIRRSKTRQRNKRLL